MLLFHAVTTGANKRLKNTLLFTYNYDIKTIALSASR